MVTSIGDAILAASSLLGLGFLRSAESAAPTPAPRGSGPALRTIPAPQPDHAPDDRLQARLAETIAADLAAAGYLKA
ncbi:hypothetical protein [Methylobacterium planeticum]|uniref:Uncharacterized protein n=1 Tax=Methylobacterium planeticum TaxID=2615211 RepID=A0A6N6MX79_9HYPH|nr:hypothetical protein [Methylobacterium planeticum]KAB1075681.1 hypothetical protein F6X51_03135 [Methylobacterium planeticum]